MKNDTTILWHLGSPMRDINQLTASLRKDAELLGERQVMVRRTRRYRDTIFNFMMEIEIEGLDVTRSQELLATLCGNREMHRLLLSDGTYLGFVQNIFTQDGFYRGAFERALELKRVFPDNPSEFFLEICHPSTLIGEIEHLLETEEAQELAASVAFHEARWSDVVSSLKEAMPESPLTIWRYEDRPIVWPQVLRCVAGVDPEQKMKGELDATEQYLPDRVRERLARFIDARPELSAAERRLVIKRFLSSAKSHKSDTANVMADPDTTLTYANDLEQIRAIDGVVVLD